MISGGQTGVDQAALRAAQRCGFDVGGWCPPGRACEGGTVPPDLPLRETPADRSVDAPDVPRSLRTEWNVRDADATLILRPAAPPADPGTAWTVRCAERSGRPLLVCDPADPEAPGRIAGWLTQRGVRTLNVAGARESTHPGIGAQSYALLVQVLSTLRPAVVPTPRFPGPHNVRPE